MSVAPRDFAILQKFNFERKPVGMKFLLNRPDGLEQTKEIAPICRLFMEAQDSRPFYAAKENFACVERLLLGMVDPEPTLESGQIGAKEKIYGEARANRRIYHHIQKLAKNTVRYVAFSPVDRLTFEPDILVFTAKPSDAEILFRALSYSTGKPLSSKITPVLTCAWIFVYPFISGEVNYTVTGVGYGFRLQKLLPEGLFVITVPFDLIPMLLENLQSMDWVLPMATYSNEDRAKYSAKVMEEISREYRNG